MLNSASLALHSARNQNSLAFQRARKQSPLSALVAALSILLIIVMLISAAPLGARLQGPPPPPPPPPPLKPPPPPPKLPAPPHKVVSVAGSGSRVFMTDSSSWKRTGGWGLAGAGGTTPPDASVMKSFEQHCPNVPMTSNRNNAKYVMMVDDVGVNKPPKKRYHVTVYNRVGMALYSHDTIFMDTSMRDACKAMGGRPR